MLDVTSGDYSPSEDLMANLSHYFDYSGLNNPFNKIYITSRCDEGYAVIVFMFVIAHLNKIFLLRQLGKTLVSVGTILTLRLRKHQQEKLGPDRRNGVRGSRTHDY